MAKTSFRITGITLDEEEEVAAVTAMASAAALEVITDMLGAAPQAVGETVTLPVRDALILHRMCGKITGLDPRHEHTTEIYDSLCMVIYGLIED